HGASPTDRVVQIEHAFMIDGTARQRTPAQPSAGRILGDLRAPLQRFRTLLHGPPRDPVVLELDALHVFHEARQVTQVAPQLVDLVGRALERPRARNWDALAQGTHAIDAAPPTHAA